jgi:MtN3 and saliva related transmembrane protein
MCSDLSIYDYRINALSTAWAPKRENYTVVVQGRMDTWTLLGILAGVMTSSGYIPQIVKGFRTRRMEDVSVLMPGILGAGMLLWLAYGLHEQDVPIILANIAGSAFAFTIVAQKRLLGWRRRACE